MILLRLFACVILLCGCNQQDLPKRHTIARSSDPAVAATVDLVISRAKARTDYRQVEAAFPDGLTASQYAEIAVQLMLDPLDLEQIGGDAGATYEWLAIDHAIYKLAELPGGGPLITKIADDERLVIDGAISMTVCDAAVRRGKEMLPLLEGMKDREWGLRCAEHIRAGRKTAF